MDEAARSVSKKLGKTFKKYGRLTIPNKLLKNAKRREAVLILDETRYVFEADKYGRVYIPPEIRERMANMQMVEMGLTDSEILIKFRRF